MAISEADIKQLQAQQAIFTEALKAALEGRWTGEGSTEAWLYALNPTLQGKVKPDPFGDGAR
ncbi:MAG: hypothetical protein HYX52_05660 [Chloroflexi bacterium]|nr:hypothetical protein [Chloroflexota bacterium]